jgi:hypothetical protein
MAKTIHLIHNLTVTMATGSFSDPTVTGCDLNIVRKKTSRESIRMVHAIHRFNPVLAYKLMGGMAVIADSRRFMAGFKPTVQIFLHDMAVGTGL